MLLECQRQFRTYLQPRHDRQPHLVFTLALFLGHFIAILAPLYIQYLSIQAIATIQLHCNTTAIMT